VFKWAQLLGKARPIKFVSVKNIKNSARFLTTIDFDREYLRNGSTYRKSCAIILTWETTRYISARRGCWPLKFLHALEIDQGLLVHTPGGLTLGSAPYFYAFIFNAIMFIYRLSKRLGLRDFGSEILPRYIRADGLEQGRHEVSWTWSLFTSRWHQWWHGEPRRQKADCFLRRYVLLFRWFHILVSARTWGTPDWGRISETMDLTLDEAEDFARDRANTSSFGSKYAWSYISCSSCSTSQHREKLSFA